MKQRSAFRNRLEFLVAAGALATLECAPAGAGMRLARVYARLFDKAMPRLRRVALRNLEIALPETTSTERQAIADGVFRSIARLLFFFARFPRVHKGNVSAYIRYEGFEHFEEALRRGQGVLFATAHLGNWEFSAFAHALMAAPMHVVVRPLDNPLIDALVARRRALSGNRLIDKREYARSILKALAANEAVGILIDQNSSLEQGVFADFFGIAACASTGLAKIAARTGASVIPGFALWSDEEQRYVLRFYPPLKMTGCAEEDTRQLQKQLEAVIREHPDQWLWIHRRWKTRPPGEPPIY